MDLEGNAREELCSCVAVLGQDVGADPLGVARRVIADDGDASER